MDRIIGVLGHASRIINRALGGTPGHTLCRRMGETYGTSCLFCRVIGFILRQPDHCERELD